MQFWELLGTFPLQIGVRCQKKNSVSELEEKGKPRGQVFILHNTKPCGVEMVLMVESAIQLEAFALI
jgi:hypothetical protein